MATRTTDSLPAALKKARERFEAWRKTRTGGDRIPDRLWNVAVLSLTTFGTLRTELRYLTRSPQLGEPTSLWATSRGGNGLGSDNDDPDHQVMTKTRIRRRYDHRLRRLVHQSGDVQLAVQNGVPRSTARDWSRLSTPDVVSLDVLSMSEEAVQQEVVALRQRNAKLLAVLRLVVVLLKVSGVTLANRRLVDGSKKLRLLGAVERSRDSLSLRTALRILGLSSTRYHTWKREEAC